MIVFLIKTQMRDLEQSQGECVAVNLNIFQLNLLLKKTLIIINNQCLTQVKNIESKLQLIKGKIYG